jgi:hypothetical protein
MVMTRRRRIERRKNRGATVPTLFIVLEGVATAEFTYIICRVFDPAIVACVAVALSVAYMSVSALGRYFKVLARIPETR